MGLVAGLVALVLVLEPNELPPIAPDPVAPDDAPMLLPDPMADELSVEEELPMLPELGDAGDIGAEDMLDGAGVAAGVVVAPVSSTFLPQAPRASRAANAMLVAMAGFTLSTNIFNFL
ncbi:MAG: hypothetical protein V4625_01670 [Pseudomonadota bacterium]